MVAILAIGTGRPLFKATTWSVHKGRTCSLVNFHYHHDHDGVDNLPRICPGRVDYLLPICTAPCTPRAFPSAHRCALQCLPIGYPDTPAFPSGTRVPWPSHLIGAYQS